MCIIIYKEAGKEIKDEWMNNSARSNPDGFGMCYVKDDTRELTIYKNLIYHEFRKKFRKAEAANPNASFLLHFRKNTVGATSIDNCHPFIVNDDIVMMHNGTISPAVPSTNSKEKRSDSKIFAEDTLANLPEGWMNNEAVCDLIEQYITKSKLAIMDKDGTVLFINEEGGHWYEGLWVSNYSYYPHTKSIQKSKPSSWEENVHKHKNKGKGSKKKGCTVYKHPGGEFTRYINCVKFMWDYVNCFWTHIDNEGKRVASSAVRYGDAPLQSRNTVLTVSYRIDGTPDRESLKKTPMAPSNLYGRCGWCGEVTHRSDLAAFGLPNGKEDDKGVDGVDIELLCVDCAMDMEYCEGVSELPTYNIDYLMSKARREAVV